MEYNNRPFNLIDGATGETLQVIREVNEKKKISENPELPLEDRLEVYEDIFDSEVGDTSLVRARNIEREVGRYLDFTSKRGVSWYAYTRKISNSGVMGDPTKASDEKGKKFWEIMITHLVALVEDLKSMNLEEIYQRKF